MKRPKRDQPGSGNVAALLRGLEKQIDALARSTEREFREVHHSMNYLSERETSHFEILQGKVDGINRRMDVEVESRSKLADRLSNVEERL